MQKSRHDKAPKFQAMTTYQPSKLPKPGGSYIKPRNQPSPDIRSQRINTYTRQQNKSPLTTRTRPGEYTVNIQQLSITNPFSHKQQI